MIVDGLEGRAKREREIVEMWVNVFTSTVIIIVFKQSLIYNE